MLANLRSVGRIWNGPLELLRADSGLSELANLDDVISQIGHGFLAGVSLDLEDACSYDSDGYVVRTLSQRECAVRGACAGWRVMRDNKQIEACF